MKCDVIIIGGGPGGLSAALWCDELGLEALLLEAGDEFGGQLLWTHNAIENHLGLRAASGREMRDRFIEQVRERNFIRRLNAEAAEVDAAGRKVRLTTGEQIAGRALIVATGVRRRKLNIEGEGEFTGRGILRSGKLDADSVAGQTVVVIGGGDAALENALILSGVAAQVYVVYRGKEIRAREEFVKRAEGTPKISFLSGMTPTMITGNDRVSGVWLKNRATGEESTVAADAVVIRIGVEPNTEFLGGQIDLDAGGYIKVNNFCETSADGIYAIGDAANPIAPTVSTAVGMGAVSVKSVYSRLKR